VTGAAWGVHEVVGENMAAAIRIHLAEKGRDPRRHALFAFGGGGPLHASHVAKKLHITRIICPLAAGVLSAFGFLAAPAAFDFIRTYITRLDGIDWDELTVIYADMERRGRVVLAEAGIPDAEMRFIRTADMRYVGQLHDITVPVPSGPLTVERRAEMEQAFHDTYHALYGRFATADPVEALNWRLLATGPDPHLTIHHAAVRRDGEALKGQRPVYFHGQGYADAPVYDRYRLAPGFTVAGPAIVEERESTVIVHPGDALRIDAYLNLIIDLQPRREAVSARRGTARARRGTARARGGTARARRGRARARRGAAARAAAAPGGRS
jgi:N-methylhydantoinase A